MTPSRAAATLLLAFAPALSACGSGDREDVSTSALEAKRQTIMGGVPSSRESVVAIRVDNPGDTSDAACSASLVAPRLLLTARHCVSVSYDGQFVCTIEGNIDEDFPRNPFNAGEMGATSVPSNITVFTGATPNLSTPAARGVRIFAPDTNSFCRNDIAFVELDTDLDLPIATLRLYDGVFPGESVTAVGFGLNELQNSDRRELGGLSVLSVGPSEFYSVVGNSMPHTFVLGQSACKGDSGGPAVSDETGAVLGVFSLLRGECTSSEVRSFSTQVAPYYEFVESVFEEVGAVPLVENSEPTLPMAGTGGTTQDGAHELKKSGGCALAVGPSGAVGEFRFGFGLWLLVCTSSVFLFRARGDANSF